MRIVKLGGRAQAERALVGELAELWKLRPGGLCIVHGGGDEVTAVQRRLLPGEEPRFVGGRRVTTPEDLTTLRMVLSGSVNKRLTAELVSAGVPAVGLSGEDASLLACVRSGAGLGEVGEPTAVNAALLRHLLSGGYLPVVSPVGRNATTNDGAALNVNGDDAAAAIAGALAPAELWFVSDVPGVLVDGAPLSRLDPSAVPALVASGRARDGMRAKLEASLHALSAGVTRVRLGDRSLLRDPASGTLLSPSPVAV